MKKFTLIVSTLVLGLGLCSQSFGFELLDRMLGVSNGTGCADKCCEPSCAAPEVTCCDPAPSCCSKSGGLFSRLHASKNCGKQVTCGCEANGCAQKGNGRCVKVDPSCGVDPCADACKPRCRPSLLDRIFACNRCKPTCCQPQPTCGCEATHGSAPAPSMDHDMPPAPVVDPSVYVPAQRRVVHASSTSVR